MILSPELHGMPVFCFEQMPPGEVWIFTPPEPLMPDAPIGYRSKSLHMHPFTAMEIQYHADPAARLDAVLAHVVERAADQAAALVRQLAVDGMLDRLAIDVKATLDA